MDALLFREDDANRGTGLPALWEGLGMTTPGEHPLRLLGCHLFRIREILHLSNEHRGARA